MPRACSRPHHSPITPRRYQQPIPRPDGAFVEGVHKFTLQFNVWKIFGHNGDVQGEAGMPNATCKKPICEHVKNVLRGRKAWGLRHQLQAVDKGWDAALYV